jgi:hypothetical protein
MCVASGHIEMRAVTMCNIPEKCGNVTQQFATVMQGRRLFILLASHLNAYDLERGFFSLLYSIICIV